MKTQAKPKSQVLAEIVANAEPIPGFDCLEMKRQGQERIRTELQGLTPEQVREYWDARHAELLKLQAAAQAKLAEKREQ